MKLIEVRPHVKVIKYTESVLRMTFKSNHGCCLRKTLLKQYFGWFATLDFIFYVFEMFSFPIVRPLRPLDSG